MLLAVIERLEEPVKILLVSSVAVEHHRGNENFVMRPPELHIVLIRLGRQALGVDKVQKSTVFLVPTGADGVVEDGLRLFDEFRLAELLCVLQQEPHALDIVTRVDDATVCEVKARRAVRGDIFQCTAEIKLDKILENFLDALRRARGVNILALRVAAHEDERDIEIDHRNAEGAAAARFGNDFGSHADRVFHAVVEIPIEVCHLPRAGKATFVAVTA